MIKESPIVELDVSALYKPLRLKKVVLRNRLVVPAMQRGASEGGRPPPALAEYYRRRIEGGFSLIIAESCAVDHPSASHKESVVRMNESTMEAWRDCVVAVSGVGGHTLIQLWHEGAQRSELSAGLHAGIPTISPSGLLNGSRRSGRSATLEELQELESSYVRSALMALEIGAAGVEIHAGHGYLLDQFLWAQTNRRDDGYGGDDLAHRLRFPAEVVSAVRRATGPDFIISFRFSQWKVSYEGLTPIIDANACIVRSPQELDLMLTTLRHAGVDMFHASTRNFDRPEWPPSNRGLAGWSRGLAGVPVITVGSIGGNNDAEESSTRALEGAGQALRSSLSRLMTRFQAGEFDLVAIGRASIGDPDWANKVKDSRFGEIRRFDRQQLLEIRNQIT